MYATSPFWVLMKTRRILHEIIYYFYSKMFKINISFSLVAIVYYFSPGDVERHLFPPLVQKVAICESYTGACLGYFFGNTVPSVLGPNYRGIPHAQLVHICDNYFIYSLLVVIARKTEVITL